MSRCDKLREWFTAGGGRLSPKVQLTESPANGIHVRGAPTLETEHPPAETLICACPLSLTLSYLNAVPPKNTQTRNPVRHVSGDLTLLHDVIPSHVLSRFVLIEQRLLGPDSFWEPYISCLPLTEEDERLSTPLYFSGEDKQWLRGTNISNAIDTRRTLWMKEWTVACVEMDNHGLNASRKYTWDLYLWAATIYSSRGFTSSSSFPGVETFALLYPVIDCLNHQSGARVSWNFDNGNFSLSTTDKVQAGKEIWNNYGAKSNEELLMGYGFCIPNNPCEEVAIKLGRLVPQVLENLRAAHILDPETDTEPFNMSLYLRDVNHYSGGYSNFASCLRGIPPLMVRAALETCLAIRRKDPEDSDFASPSGRLAVATMRQLLAPIRKKHDYILETNPTFGPTNTKQKHAKVYRDGQLEILRSIIDSINWALQEQMALPKLRFLDYAIIDTRQAIAILKRENPIICHDFLLGVGGALVDPENLQELQEQDCEDVVWILWLCVAYIHARQAQKAYVIRLWLQDIERLFKITPLQDGEMDETLDYINDLIETAAGALPQDTVWHSPAWTPALTAWAARVVQFEVWQMRAPGNEERFPFVMYMHMDGKPEKWVLPDAGLAGQSVTRSNAANAR